MSSFPRFYSNYSSFPSDFTDFPNICHQGNTNVLNQNSMCGHQQESFHNIPMLDHIASMDSCDSMASSWGVPTCAAAEMEMGMAPAGGAANNGIGGNFQNITGGYPLQLQVPLHLAEFGEECCGFVEDIKVKPPPYPNTTPTENWGSFHQGNQMAAAAEEPNNIKVGRYSEEERKERILRYLKKRNQRNFNKTIKYACRKTLADRRVRVRGRFARNNELCEDEMTMKKNENIPHKQDLYYADDSIQFQLKNEDDEDDWLQEAMASLVYLSHSSPEEM